MYEERVYDEIKKIVRSFDQLPYLFVGTGFSMRYGNAPSWNELLEDLWIRTTDGTSAQYKKFVQQKSRQLDGLLGEPVGERRKYYLNPALATEIQDNFDERCYIDTEFECSCFSDEEIEKIADQEIDPFKYLVCKTLNKVSIDSGKDTVFELDGLKNYKNKIAGIITTNYDNLLESLFPDFGVLVGQDNLLVSRTENVFEIFKIHGSCESPNTVVITQNDYDKFRNKLKYLSAKLLTIFVEHPVIFLGYSIGDLNIRAILNEIAICLTPEQLERLTHNLIFVNPIFDNADDEIKEIQIDFGDSNRIGMTQLCLKDFSSLYESLSEIKSSMPVKLIRKMQDMICEFVFSSNATSKVVVGSLSDPDLDDDKVGIYVGSASAVSNMGFDTFGIWDIIEDVIFDNKPFLMDQGILKTFENIRSRGGLTLLPIHKYINGLGLSTDIIPLNWHVILKRDDFKLNYSERIYAGLKGDIHATHNTIAEIEADDKGHYLKEFSHAMASIDSLEIEELREYLKRKFNDFSDKEISRKYGSVFKKLVALFDFKLYAK